MIDVGVANGSMTSSGESDVLQCDTDEPPCTGLGAYISTWPLACTPADSTPLAATTFAPTQCRSSVSVMAVRRSPLVIVGKSSPVEWSSRFRM